MVGVYSINNLFVLIISIFKTVVAFVKVAVYAVDTEVVSIVATLYTLIVCVS